MQNALPFLRRTTSQGIKWALFAALMLGVYSSKANSKLSGSLLHTSYVKANRSSAGYPSGNVFSNAVTKAFSGKKSPVSVLGNSGPATQPVPAATDTVVCKGTKVTLSISSGTLNSSTAWHWYSGSCGGTVVGTGATMMVTPTVTTTYYARGEGGGVAMGSCGSIVIKVKQPSSSTVNATVCSNQTYSYNGKNYTAGTYIVHLTNAAGCDSAVTLRLTTIRTTTKTISATICDNTTYILNGTSYSSTGVYVQHRTNKAGCDSAITLNLTVKKTSRSTVNLSFCSGTTLTYNKVGYTSAGTYTVHLANKVGCDSVVTLVLTTKSTSSSTTNQAICAGQSYTFGGTAYSMSGTYTKHYTNAIGCDSAAILVLVVNPKSASSVSATICSNKSYAFNGNIYTTAGTYTAHLTNRYGCDSAITLTLKVNKTSTTSLTATICSNQSYVLAGTRYRTSGTYVANLTNKYGCDSTVTLVLTVKDTSTSSASATICNGKIYYFNGKPYTAAGTYIVHRINKAGCDSSITFTLNVLNTSSSTLNASTCKGKTYAYNGKTYGVAGTYTIHFTNSIGCDSAVTLNLTVNNNSTSTTNASICPGGSYTFNGTTYTAGGTYFAHLTNSVGCDSSAALVLHMGYNSSGYLSVPKYVYCVGDTFRYNGQAYTQTGVYVVHITNHLGCDSAVTIGLYLSRAKASRVVINDTTCDNQPVLFAGNYYKVTGAYYSYGYNVANCDSTTTLKLWVFKVNHKSKLAHVCSPDYNVVGHDTMRTSGIYIDTLTNIHKCDSIITTTLYVGNASSGTLDTSICQGQTYVERFTGPFGDIFGGPYGDGDGDTDDSTTTLAAPGTYTIHMYNASGCDSMLTLNLGLRDTSTSTISASICQGQKFQVGDSVHGDSMYSVAGSYLVHINNAAHCDSAVYLTLTVNNNTTFNIDTAICSNVPYQNGDSVYTMAGSYVLHYANSTGCDSALTVNISIRNTSSSTVNAAVCSNQAYLFNGNSYNIAGTYTATVTNSVGCDSVITLNLTLGNISYDTVNATICSNQSYAFNGSSYNLAGSYAATLTNVAGCDSVVTLNLTVNDTSIGIVNATICSNQSDTFNGSIYSAAGTYTATLTNSVGCDSVAMLVLSVNATSSSITTASICDNQTYTFNGNDYTAAGTYTATLTSSVGCDSVATLVLSVNATNSSTTTASICDNQTYTFNGNDYTTAGTYTATLTNSVGCDSVATLVLSINATSSGTTTATICDNQTYSFNGTSYTTAGTYTATLTNSVGCDSVATLVLSVNATSSSTTTASICDNQTYTFNGTDYSTAGTYTSTLTNSVGCDSVAMLVLSVNATSSSTTTASICDNQTYTFNGSDYTTAGTYTASLTNSAGCDSVATLNLTVRNTTSSTVNASICSNKSYSFNGSNYTTAGTYTATLTNKAGCDSVVTLNLTVRNTSSSTVNASICSNKSYSFNGSTYTIAGSYNATLTNSVGCDSVVTLNLTVNPTSSTSLTATICSNQSYPVDGHTYNTAGTYVNTLTNRFGCDSVVTLVLTVKKTSTSTTNATTCSNVPYAFNGTSYNTQGTYVAHLTNKVGCDSAATLNLTVKQASSKTVSATICQGSSYSFLGTNYTVTGLYLAKHYTNKVGCDSSVYLNLTVNPKTTSTVAATICSNKSYVLNGTTYTIAGTYTQHITNKNGCDSAITLTLTVNKTSATTINATICSNQSYIYRGISYTTAGTYTFLDTNIAHCDSVITLKLTVKNTSSSSISASFCTNLTYILNGVTYTTPGTYVQHKLNKVQCDSAITLTLTGKSPSTSTTNASICSGGSYVFGGTTYTVAGTYVKHYTNAVGCDSAASLVLVVNPKSTSTATATICSNQSYTFNGSTFTTAGNYVVHLTNRFGCDSAITLTLKVNKTSTTTVTASICSNQTYTFNGTSYNTTGSYTVHLTNKLGCDSAVTLNLTVKATSASSISASFCTNLTYSLNGVVYSTPGTYVQHKLNKLLCDSAITLTLTGKSPSTSTTNAAICTGGSYMFGGTSYSAAGTYVKHYTNAVGCDSAASLVLVVNPKSTSTVTATICSNQSYTVGSTSFTTAGTYLVHLTNKYGCDSAVTLKLTVLKTTSSTVTATTCSNIPYSFNGNTYSATGSYVVHLTNKAGCDSAITLNLTVKNASSSTINATICSNQTYTLNGTVYSSTGTYVQHKTNKVGCDSAITLNLTVNSTSSSTISATICSNQSYVIGSNTYTTSGTYTAHLTNKAGCDSAITLNLTVNKTSSSTISATICSNQSYSFNGNSLTSSGTYTAHHTNKVGCDSTVTLTLTVKNTSSSSLTGALCSGASFVYNGTTYTTGGSFTIHFTNKAGCDSSVFLNIVMRSNSTSSVSATICSNQSYTIGSNTYTTAGTYTAHLTNKAGCDSAVTLTLTVNSTSSSSISAAICNGQTYNFNGTNVTTAGTYTTHKTNKAGCDSAITLTLTVNSNTTASQTKSLCPGQSYTLGGTTYTTAGTYTAHITNKAGCDSAITLTIKALANTTRTITTSTCSNVPFVVNGVGYSTSGTYVIHFSNKAGCDSAVTLNLTVKQTSASSVAATICSGQIYTLNGTNYTIAGTYVQHKTNKVGCDSAITLTLTVNPKTSSSLSFSFCSGTTFTYNGKNYTTSGTSVVHLTNRYGCDSAITLTLTTKAPTTSTTTKTICSPATYTFNGTTYSTTGSHTVHLTNKAGCDSAATLNLTVNQPSTSSVSAAICPGASYVFNGTTYTTAGTYVTHKTNKKGCDSAITLTLTIKSTSASTTNARVCSGQSYMFNGTSYTTAGTYVKHLTNSVGCDSAATLVLTLKPNSTSAVSASFCAGSTFAFNGNNYTTAGTYVAHISNKVGCDSAITLTLTSKAKSTKAISATICSNQSYAFNGSTLTTGGTYTAHLTNKVGCDSAVTLTLTVKLTSSSSTSASICNGTSYSFGGNSYKTAGTYLVHSLNAVGCDSAATLVLTILDTSKTSVSASICSGASYTFNGTSYSSAGTYTKILSNKAGCDSAITLTLSVTSGITSSVSASICNGQTYKFGTRTLTSAGTYTAHFTAKSGCDSAVSLTLSVKSGSSSSVSASICNGQSYVIGSNTYTTAGTYLGHTTNAKGCDSAVTLTLTVRNKSTTSVSASICPGGSYSFNGSTYTSAGTYTAHLTNKVGCDSAITLTLTVKSTSSSAVSASICTGASYSFNGSSYSSAGTYVAHLTNKAGCDSAITLTLTVKPTSASTVNATICPGQSYPVAGSSFSSTGTYTVHTTGSNGCDSAITLNLTVLNASASTVNASICNGQSYSFNGSSYSTAGSFTVHLSNSVACDSAVTLVLTLKATSSSSVSASMCPGATYSFNGNTYSSAGTYTVHLTNKVGCDSAVTLTLTLKSNTSSSVSASICNGTAYSYNGTSYTTAGTYTVHLTNAAGCDSAVSLTITVKPVSKTTLNVSICTGQSYTAGGNSFTTAGTYTIHNTNAVGCDSSITLNLSVNSTSSSAISATICSNQNYSFNGTLYTSAGTYTAHVTNKAGCDSAVTLTLTVNATSTSSTSASTCSNTPYAFNGSSYSTAGTYTAHLTNKAGCDSAATLVLTVRNTSSSSLSTFICPSGSYTFNGSTYSAAGTYTAHLTNSVGCDSAATLILTVNSNSFTTINTSVCAGSTYKAADSALKASGTYTVVTTNASHCDSIITVHLTVKPVSTSSVSASICSNQSYSFNGSTYTTAGSYTKHLTNSVGCDSAVTLTLTVKATTSSTTNASVCSGASFTFNGASYSSAGSYTAHLTNTAGCDSAATLILTIKNTSTSSLSVGICTGKSYNFNGSSYSTTGNYTAHLTNSVGCDSAATLILTVTTTTTASTVNKTICTGQTFTYNGTNYTNAGTYSVTLLNAGGCDSFVTLNLTVINGANTKTINATICSNQSYTVGSNTYTTAGTYVNHFTNKAGCDSAVTLNLTVNNTTSSTVKVKVCNSGSYSYNGSSYAVGTYVIHFTNKAGCDSAVTLSVKNATTIVLTMTKVGSTLKLSWTGGVGPYTVVYSPLNTNVGYVTVTNVVDSSYTISSVTSGVTYTAYIVDQGCSSDRSVSTYYNVPGGSSCTGAAPYGLSVTPSYTSATATWSGANGTYQVFYKPVASNTWSATANSTGTFNFSGLTANTCYVMYVTNICTGVYGYSTPFDTFCTKVACNAPATVTISNITCHGFKASWTAQAGITDYQIFIGNNSYHTGNVTSYTTSSLSPGTTYKVFIKSWCDARNLSTNQSKTDTVITLSSGCKDVIGGNALDANATGVFNVYPNPNNGQFTINLVTNNTIDDGRLLIVNALGQVVGEQRMHNSNGLINGTISNTSLASGMYLIRVIVGGDTYTSRIIVQQ